MEKDKWISQFNVPDENALIEIRRLVDQLTPADFPKRHWRNIKDATAKGFLKSYQEGTTAIL